ncbi:FKBP-type peptidyl-prolyl cis-trans isomerase [Hymenobacter mucosus]|uniref:Peptidyl-prolyl cis-trans isomerase n=1 Tax=Hymenobacter mucosus TaxID=1411120 RepID=A0A238ZPC0_9BACT|nr:FKBP-type peptidyl-prolyl cis-trans isomerase [Hymenobacter mucosus]SNR85296.1 FKBP-type peptidyl-prolyl cis-trans isomerase [Hymenobacter mucosus]
MSFFTRPALLLRLAATLLVTVPVLSGCDTEPSYAKQIREQTEAQRALDEATIQAYLTRHNITGSQYTRTNSGLYLVSLTNGPATNPLITKGQKVTVNYVGKYIYEANDGVIFDNSSNNRTSCGCFSFTAGGGGIISGWEEAALLMRKGDRKLLLVPSELAYREVGYGSIPPYTPLLFDLEIQDVQ